jgi:hypothetical protein
MTYSCLLNLPPSADIEFEVFNDTQLASLRLSALKLFVAPPSSAASKRVFSQAALITKPTIDRVSQRVVSFTWSA